MKAMDMAVEDILDLDAEGLEDRLGDSGQGLCGTWVDVDNIKIGVSHKYIGLQAGHGALHAFQAVGNGLAGVHITKRSVIWGRLAAAIGRFCGVCIHDVPL